MLTPTRGNVLCLACGYLIIYTIPKTKDCLAIVANTSHITKSQAVHDDQNIVKLNFIWKVIADFFFFNINLYSFSVAI